MKYALIYTSKVLVLSTRILGLFKTKVEAKKAAEKVQKDISITIDPQYLSIERLPTAEGLLEDYKEKIH